MPEVVKAACSAIARVWEGAMMFVIAKGRKAAARVVLIGLSLAVVTTALLITEKVDNGYIIMIGGTILDPVGEIREAANRVTRDCSQVSKIEPNTDAWLNLQRQLEAMVPESTAAPRIALRAKSWVLVEADFSNNEPGISLLEDTDQGFREVASYGGTAAPFRDGPIIRDYLIHQAPSAPLVLIQCYDPVGAPFRRQ